ncbi:hypothetical protein; putative membrane protein [Pseudorhizobium banfieldiae]|uniref:Uncharacterized protein n=1 Tax=Pseudorhizobium banfieldiae TaxID=1125847 RepID=L0ND93_9HYPH|nr:hypothetical protein RNT25_01433 [arsenite-oxidising bacterium NT-25]CCF18776.1 hypothetical protein; putative membrane protein [Pseudorhizobium banfieldiae]
MVIPAAMAPTDVGRLAMSESDSHHGARAFGGQFVTERLKILLIGSVFSTCVWILVIRAAVGVVVGHP